MKIVPILFALVAATLAPASPVAHDITLPAAVIGRTPQHIGYNTSQNIPGSNASDWIEYSGMTAARFWWPLAAWPDDPLRPPANSPDENLQNTLAAFEHARARLRRDPLAPDAADWPAHEARIAQIFGGGRSGMTGDCYSLSEFRRLGVDILCPLTIGARNALAGGRFPLNHPDGTPDWISRHAYWRGIYLNAFYLARHYDIRRFQLFNEPDHRESQPITQEQFLTLVQLGSDAVRAAIDDVNRLYDRHLVPLISAPVTAGLDVYLPRSGRPDTRDAARGWGQFTLAAIDDDYPGRSLPRRPLFDQYAFQIYTRDPRTIDRQAARVLTAMRADRPQGIPPLIISEMNVSTAAAFLKTADTLDTPAYYAAFGAIAAAYTRIGLKELYVFRFTQSANMPDGQIKKNGTHVIDQNSPLQPILRSTKGAEAARLYTRAFAGGLDLTKVPAPDALPENLSLLAAREPHTGQGRVLVANTNPTQRRLRLRLEGWSFPPAAPWYVEEVSHRAHGAITAFGVLAPDNTVTLEVPAMSNLVLRIDPAIPEKPSSLRQAPRDNGRWRIGIDPPPPPSTGWIGVSPNTRYTGTTPRILRVWLETPEGIPQRILGHTVIARESPPQWLRLRPGESEKNLLLRIEPEEPGQPPVTPETLDILLRDQAQLSGSLSSPPRT
ncbi:hypothetical protein OPIT5_12585 [Opitutaceae bacterium TAV5]|nr:hypothetical protein OPIT5_12585 [Opitutaceae bacterium TAV5]